MPNFIETSACLAFAYRNKFINEQEFALLYDAHKSKIDRVSVLPIYEGFHLGEPNGIVENLFGQDFIGL